MVYERHTLGYENGTKALKNERERVVCCVGLQHWCRDAKKAGHSAWDRFTIWPTVRCCCCRFWPWTVLVFYPRGGRCKVKRQRDTTSSSAGRLRYASTSQSASHVDLGLTNKTHPPFTISIILFGSELFPTAAIISGGGRRRRRDDDVDLRHGLQATGVLAELVLSFSDRIKMFLCQITADGDFQFQLIPWIIVALYIINEQDKNRRKEGIILCKE